MSFLKNVDMVSRALESVSLVSFSFLLCHKHIFTGPNFFLENIHVPFTISGCNISRNFIPSRIFKVEKTLHHLPK